MRLSFRPLTEEDARAILAWRYEEPYSIYDPDPDGIPGMLDPENAYHAVTAESGELIGFCCFGPDARVPGGDYQNADDTLDVGAGLRPDLTGKGAGLSFFNAILEFAEGAFAPSMFRLTVAAFNQRAIRVHERAGFQPLRTFVGKSTEREFLLLTKKC